MSKAMFFRLHDENPDRKEAALRRRIHGTREGARPENVFSAEVSNFAVIPGSPYAYWTSDAIRDMFASLAPLEGTAATVRTGVSTKDDTRFVRTWWEVHPQRIQYSSDGYRCGERWVHLAKGGSASPYYADVFTLLAWGSGQELKVWLESLYGGQHWSRDIRSPHYYFRPGLTFPRRTRRLAPAALPEGCIFSVAGQAAFATHEASPSALVGLLSSSPFFGLLRVQLPRQDADPQFEVGQIQRTPTVGPTKLGAVEEPTHGIIRIRRLEACRDEVGHPFSLPSLLQTPSGTLTEAATEAERLSAELAAQIATAQATIDSTIFDLYGFDEQERTQIQREIAGSLDSSEAEPDYDDEDVDEKEEDENSGPENLSRGVANLLMWCVGVAFGRWDLRMALDQSLIPELQEPFERLPRVAPGGLIGPDGLPATPERIASEAWLRARPDVITSPEPSSVESPDHITAADYPIEVAWDGILVDDPGHPCDIIAKVDEVLTYVYGSAERAQEIEAEALEILQAGGRTPKTLRDWFRNQKASELGKNFFDFHIQRYSKSRRKAPIYWRLTSNPGRGQAEYSVWLYYHRLTGDTLWQVLTQYVGPKRALEQRRLDDLREARGSAQGAEKSRIEKEIEEKVALLEELDWFESRLRAVAERGYRPDLDDGVIINMAPLHELAPWKEPEKVWKKLEKGEYDWAHLAMKYWPERVRVKCREDKSLAIAHGVRESK